MMIVTHENDPEEVLYVKMFNAYTEYLWACGNRTKGVVERGADVRAFLSSLLGTVVRDFTPEDAESITKRCRRCLDDNPKNREVRDYDPLYGCGDVCCTLCGSPVELYQKVDEVRVGSTFHAPGCVCGFCKMGDTRA